MVLGMVFLLADKIPAQTICDSIVPIDSIYYYTHQLPYTIIDTNNLPKKTGHEIVIPFGDSVLRFKDLQDKNPYPSDYYYQQNFVAGIDKNRNWELIIEQSVNTCVYYLLNLTRHSIDTLVDYPFIYGNMMICLEGDFTDSRRRIEIREIQGDKLVLRKSFTLRDCNLFGVGYITLSDSHEIMFKPGWIEDKVYYKLKL